QRTALGAAVVLQAGIGGVQKVQRRFGSDERERIFGGQHRSTVGTFAGGRVSRQRVEAALGELGREQLALAGPGRKATLGEWQPRIRQIQPRPALVTQPLVADALKVRMRTVERGADHVLVGIMEIWLVEAE